ncbi:MAG: acetyltransferase, family [Rubrobacteraceae bacterium]|nr:acetyltransferase, family [Rubrobacteraceae bacterium]
MEIVELCSAAERREALPILRELYASLDEDRYAGLLAEMVVDGYRQFALRNETDGYRQFALRNETAEIVALAGVAVHVNLYYGRHLYVYDLVVKEEARSKGYGGLLMDHVEGVARREGCETAALACDLEREGALRLYERRGYQKPSYAMRKALR